MVTVTYLTLKSPSGHGVSVDLPKEAVSESIEIEMMPLRRPWTVRRVWPKDTLKRFQERGPPPGDIKYAT